MTSIDVSVVVCTRNRATLLAGCLKSIAADSSTVARELIVVDNGSSDETPRIVHEAAATAPFRVRLVGEPRIGQSHARNAGVAAAQGRLLLFTDDDVHVEDGWADALVAPFADPSVGAAGGRILPVWPVPPPPWLNGPHAELLTLIDYGPDARRFGPNEQPIGANFAVRTEIARSFEGPFDPSLGHRGALRIAHDEVHFLNAVRASHAIAYVPTAVVHHIVDSDRMSLHYMRHAFFQLGVGLGRRERLEGAALPSLPRRLVRAVRTYRGAARARRRHDRVARVGSETWEELRDWMWAGKHFEMVAGRFPGLVDRLAKHLV